MKGTVFILAAFIWLQKDQETSQYDTKDNSSTNYASKIMSKWGREEKERMIILVVQYWTSFKPHHVLMSVWWHCALQLPPTHTLYRQTGTRADAVPMKTDHCGLCMSSLICDVGGVQAVSTYYSIIKWAHVSLHILQVFQNMSLGCTYVLIICIQIKSTVYGLQICVHVSVWALLMKLDANRWASDVSPPFRLTVSQERTPQSAENITKIR